MRGELGGGVMCGIMPQNVVRVREAQLEGWPLEIIDMNGCHRCYDGSRA